MIWKLLRKNISMGQILGYSTANFIGLAIVLSAIRFYGDVSAALDNDSDGNPVIPEDYMVLSKPVSAMNTIGIGSTTFSDEEISDLESQPWAVDVGSFISADFNVGASINIGGNGLSTYLFLESIPDEFIDITPDSWRFDPTEPGKRPVPIIISKDYLALYNFGLAASRGLPQISESLMSKVPMTLHLSGNGHNDQFPARIAGFSNRLNTIAVPMAFMRWANDRYSAGDAAAPSRLIVKVNRPGDPSIRTYIDDMGYEVAGDKIDNSRASYFLTVLTSVVGAVGVVISALALFILMLSIFLLLQKSKDKIVNLLQLGYSPMQVSAGYFRLIGTVNATVLLLSVAAMFLASGYWEVKLAQLSVKPSSPFPAMCAGLIIMLAITAVNFAAIYRAVRADFTQK